MQGTFLFLLDMPAGGWMSVSCFQIWTDAVGEGKACSFCGFGDGDVMVRPRDRLAEWVYYTTSWHLGLSEV